MLSVALVDIMRVPVTVSATIRPSFKVPEYMPEPTSPFELHLAVEHAGVTAVDMLAQATGLSRQHIKQVMQKGAVWLEEKGAGKPRRFRRAKKALAVGDKLHLYYDAEVLAETPAQPQLIVDEGAYSIWYKPCGLRSQGSKWGDHCTLQRWVEQNLTPQRPAFVVHRLDRAATGLIIIAHQKKVATALAGLFAKREVEKRYRVIVHGRFAAGAWPQKIDSTIDGRPACSFARLLEYDAVRDRSLLEVRIDTGRKHQIRKHLAGIGFPVVGDRLYGRQGDTEDLQLTACYLAFMCPVTQQKKIWQFPEPLSKK